MTTTDQMIAVTMAEPGRVELREVPAPSSPSREWQSSGSPAPASAEAT